MARQSALRHLPLLGQVLPACLPLSGLLENTLEAQRLVLRHKRHLDGRARDDCYRNYRRFFRLTLARPVDQVFEEVDGHRLVAGEPGLALDGEEVVVLLLGGVLAVPGGRGDPDLLAVFLFLHLLLHDKFNAIKTDSKRQR